MTKFLQAIDRIRADADKRTEAVIASARLALLVPYCERTGMRFTAGMGTWSFDYWDRYGTHQFISDWDELKTKRIPRGLYNFLCELDVTSRNDLGAVMEDYTPSTYKARHVPKPAQTPAQIFDATKKAKHGTEIPR